MVRPQRDFENDLLHELKFRAHCKNKSPDHFCDQKDLAKNLKMSLRDVGLNLHAMSDKGILEHERVIVNTKRKDKFTPVDPRRYQPEKMIKNYTRIIKDRFVFIEKLTKQVKETPALYDVDMKPISPLYDIRVVKDLKNKAIVQKALEESRHNMRRPTVMTSKINKKGDLLLDRFCGEINQMFAICDSFSYSQQIANIPKSEDINKAIYEIKEYTFRKTKKLIEYILKGLPYLQKQAIGDAIMPKIPILYHMIQVERISKL